MNSVNLIGRLTRDPEAEHTANGTPVCRLRLAVPRRPRNGADRGAVFVTVVAYGPQAQACAEHLGRGRQVAVSGRLEHREWNGPEGSVRSIHEVVADHVGFLGSSPGATDAREEPSAPPGEARRGVA